MSRVLRTVGCGVLSGKFTRVRRICGVAGGSLGTSEMVQEGEHVATQHSDERDAEVTTISHGDLVKMYASSAAKALSMETAQFLADWESGRIDDVLEKSDHPDVVRWNMLMSFGREHAR
jgi:hypothetical protein